MKSLAAIFSKEWSEHRWSLFTQCGFCLLCFALIFYKEEGIKTLSRGSFSLAFQCWPIFSLIIANLLAFRLYTLESKERTSLFLAGLPIPRWHILTAKVFFCWFALTLVCLIYFVCAAAVSPQAQLTSWQSIVYPLVRLSTFNWFVVTLIFLVSMVGKFRWYFYLVVMAILIYIKSSGVAVVSLLKTIPAVRLVDEERALGDLAVLPWDLILQTIGIGCGALVVILLVDRIVQGFQLENHLSRLLSVSDRMVVALVILSIPALFLTVSVSINKTPARLDLEYHLAFEVDHQARSGATLVELCYYKASPEDELEEVLDQRMIADISGLLETARQRLDPRWWPERWVVVKSPDVKNEAKTWAKRLSGDALIIVVNWDSKEIEKKGTDRVFAIWQMTCLLDSMMISKRHDDRHGWVTAGLARALIPSVSGKHPQKKKNVDSLIENDLDNWPSVVRRSKDRHVFSSGILAGIENQLSEDEFNAWIREVGRLSFTKPESNTLFSLGRGYIYWRGLLQDSVEALERRGFDPKPVVEAMQSQIVDEE